MNQRWEWTSIKAPPSQFPDLRTHILVCLGAIIIMIASTRMAILSQVLPSASRVQVDPGRIAAGIVTGIGFLGAGAIIRIGDLVRGLTTVSTILALGVLRSQHFRVSVKLGGSRSVSE
jgi:uncharacterized membrane protein YhiD involved in acid resistance